MFTTKVRCYTCLNGLHSVTWSYIHKVTEGNTWLQATLHKAVHGYTRVALDYRWLYQITKEYIQLHEATQGIT